MFPVDHPIVPLGQSRLRIILHARNTEDEVTRLVDAIFSWVAEMQDIEYGKTKQKVSKAARDVYAWMERQGLTGYGWQHSKVDNVDT